MCIPSVGGGTQMLKEIGSYKPENTQKIKAVVNGTLNYVSDSLRSEKTKTEIAAEVLKKRYAEPGAKSFEEIISAEANDVLLNNCYYSQSFRII